MNIFKHLPTLSIPPASEHPVVEAARQAAPNLGQSAAWLCHPIRLLWEVSHSHGQLSVNLQACKLTVILLQVTSIHKMHLSSKTWASWEGNQTDRCFWNGCLEHFCDQGLTLYTWRACSFSSPSWNNNHLKLNSMRKLSEIFKAVTLDTWPTIILTAQPFKQTNLLTSSWL